MTEPDARISPAERLDISIGRPAHPESVGSDSWGDRSLLRSDAGFRSGFGEFDRMLEQFHTIFAQTHQPGAVAEHARDAADGLARHYLSLTGRDRPEADEHAGELAAQVHAGLLSTLVPLTDTRGQSMLRLLS